MTLADRYREAYITMSPTDVGSYMTMLQSIDPDAVMSNRNGQVWIEFTDGSEWRLGSADKPASKMNHHDA